MPQTTTSGQSRVAEGSRHPVLAYSVDPMPALLSAASSLCPQAAPWLHLFSFLCLLHRVCHRSLTLDPLLLVICSRQPQRAPKHCFLEHFSHSKISHPFLSPTPRRNHSSWHQNPLLRHNFNSDLWPLTVRRSIFPINTAHGCTAWTHMPRVHFGLSLQPPP